MHGIPFISENIKAVLDKSSTIEGRFFVCPDWAAEINSSNLGQLVTAATGDENYKNFPAALLMPPAIAGDLVNLQPGRLLYGITMLFLTTTYYDSNNNVKAPSNYTGHSTHTVPMDWHDMQRCAHDFMRMFAHGLQVNDMQPFIYIDDRNRQEMQLISKIGTARLSGVSTQQIFLVLSLKH